MLSSYTVGPSLQNQKVPNCIIHTFDNCSTWVPTLAFIWTSFHCLYTTHHYLSRKIRYSFLGKIQMHVTSENCIRIHSHSQEALKAVQGAQSPLQYGSAKGQWMTFPPTTLWDSFWVSKHPGLCGNENANEITRERSVHQIVGMESAMRVSRQNMKKKINCWLGNQQTAK